jgi:hypothetical protein
VVILIALLLAGAGIGATLYTQLQAAESSNTQLQYQNRNLNQTILQVNATTPIVTINVTFIPTPAAVSILPNTVTFVTGYVQATNLSSLYFPCTLQAAFNVSYATSDRNAIVTYSYIPYQQVSLIKGIQLAELPFGIFPLSIYNATAGDIITLYATATVTATWSPIQSTMTREVTSTYWQVYVM